MSRPVWSRLLSALFALWFTLLAVEPGPLGSCPMHGGHHAMPAGVAGTHAAHGDRTAGDHAEHLARHATRAADAAVPERPDPAAHRCTCLGDCAGMAAAPALPVRPSGAIPPAIASASTPEPATPIHPVAVDRRLPFANGPPTPVDTVLG